MPHFFDKRDRWGHGLGLWILVGMVFTLPLALWSLTHLKMSNDVDQWLSEDNLAKRQFEWYQTYFPAEESLLLTWDDSHLDDVRLERLALRLRGQADAHGIRRGGSPYIANVCTPGQIVQKMLQQKLSREEAIRRLQGVLLGKGQIWGQFSLLSLNQKEKSLKFLQDQARQKFGRELVFREPIRDWLLDEEQEDIEFVEQTSGSGQDEDVATADGADAAEVGDTWEPVALTPHDVQISWAGMHGKPQEMAEFQAWAKQLRMPVAGSKTGEPVFEDCFIHPGQPAALGISLSEAGRADRKAALADIRKCAAEVAIPVETLHWGGTPVANAVLNQEVLRSLWNKDAPWYMPHQRSIVLLSWLAGLVLAFWLLRDVRLTVIVLAVSYFVTLVSVALVPAFGSSLNMVLVVMPTLLLVVSMSGAVHLANYWKNEAQRDLRTSVVQAVKTAWWPCMLAAVTTAMGLSSLLISRLAPVRDFGLFSAVGSLLSLAAVLYGVPALLQAWPAPAPAAAQEANSRRPWNRFGRWLLRYSTPICMTWLLISVATVSGLRYFRTETKVIKYFPETSSLVQDYRQIEQNVAGIIPVETVVCFGSAAQTELNFSQRQEIVRQIEEQFRKLADVTGTISLADFQPVAVAPDESAPLRERLKYNTRAKAVEQRVRKTTAASTLLQVAEQTSEFNAAGDELWRITSQVASLQSADYRQLSQQLDYACRSVLKYHAGTRHVITGMVPLFLATQQEIVDSLINSFGLAFLLIGVVMVLMARNILAGLLLMIPNVLPVGIVFGAISWRGIPVDIGTLITASVALGIAVDGTLHLVTWFRHALLAGVPQRVAVVRAVEHCGPALWQTSLAIGAAMLVLAPAELLLISRFGWLMSILIAVAMLADLVLTPAMLAGPVGWLMARTAAAERRRKAGADQPAVETPTESRASADIPAPHLLHAVPVPEEETPAVVGRVPPPKHGRRRR